MGGILQGNLLQKALIFMAILSLLSLQFSYVFLAKSIAGNGITFNYGYENELQAPGAGEVLINEMLSLPLSGGKEWLEFFSTAPVTLDLSSCVINDASSQIYSFEAEATINPSSHFLAELPVQRLNNYGDIVELICNGALIDQLRYGNKSTTASYVSTEGYEQNLGYLPDPSELNTLGRSPDGSNIW